MGTRVSTAYNIALDIAHPFKIINKIKQTWTKLTEQDIARYQQGQRSAFLKILQSKYHFTLEQAENVLSTIEHLARHSE